MSAAPSSTPAKALTVFGLSRPEPVTELDVVWGR